MKLFRGSCPRRPWSSSTFAIPTNFAACAREILLPSALRRPHSDRWLFASAPSDVLANMGPEIDFRFTTAGGTFMHNLRTIVLDPKGRIYRQFDGNEWRGNQLALAVTEAAR